MWLGGLAFIPFAYIIQKDPKLLPKALVMIPFFAIMYLVCELVSLHQGLWSFPGQYIGTVTLAGLSFPIEEFFFWIISSSAISVAYYEYLIDDEK